MNGIQDRVCTENYVYCTKDYVPRHLLLILRLGFPNVKVIKEPWSDTT